MNLVRARGYVQSKAATPMEAMAAQAAAQPAAAETQAAAKKFFPQTSSKGVAYWLLGSAASVFGLVVFGGLTRLTESG